MCVSMRAACAFLPAYICMKMFKMKSLHNVFDDASDNTRFSSS